VALVMVVAGLCFKITAVPFHWYAPDVYQGAPLPIVALLAFVPKAAGFIALLRLLGYLWIGGTVNPGLALGIHVPILFWILAVMTMTLGNVLALLQDNLKRLLAYSSVAHAGYMLIGLATAPELGGEEVQGGVPAVLFYLVAYSAMTVGTFAVLCYLSTPQRPVETVDDLAGLSRSQPGMALVMALFLFSLIGLPLTAGFAGKLMLFLGALAVPDLPPGSPERARWFRLLALAGALNAAIAAWYYLRLVAVMYLRDAVRPLQPVRRWPVLGAVAICALLTLGLGVYPALLAKETAEAARPARPELPASASQTRAE
jgi:NADH-quinone oxidoreductase subunit N